MNKSIKVVGHIKYVNIGVGTWTLQSDNGEVYELVSIPEQIKIDGYEAAVWLKLLDDYVSMNMLGIPAEVTGFSL